MQKCSRMQRSIVTKYLYTPLFPNSDYIPESIDTFWLSWGNDTDIKAGDRRTIKSGDFVGQHLSFDKICRKA